MANLDFYAAREDLIGLFDFIFTETDCRVMESYADFGELPNHSLTGIPGPHTKGGILRSTIQRGRKKLRLGTETDLRETGQ